MLIEPTKVWLAASQFYLKKQLHCSFLVLRQPEVRVSGYEDVLWRILVWNLSWLEEQEKMEKENTRQNKKIPEPPVEGDGFMVNHVPTVFSRAEDYQRFDPFLFQR